MLPAVAIAVTVALAVSVAANVWLANEVRGAFVALQLARVFPLGYTVEPEPPDRGSTAESVVFYGDSRAAAWFDTGSTGQAPTENRAHGGQTASQTLLQLQTTPAVESAIAIVQVGINDLHPLGAMPVQKQEVLRRLQASIPQIRDRLLERSRLVVLTTLFPPAPVPWSRRHAWDPETLRYIEDVNATIRRAAAHDRVVLVDAHALLAAPDGFLADAYRDPFFLHVNAAAYARINAELARRIAGLSPQHR